MKPDGSAPQVLLDRAQMAKELLHQGQPVRWNQLFWGKSRRKSQNKRPPGKKSQEKLAFFFENAEVLESVSNFGGPNFLRRKKYDFKKENEAVLHGISGGGVIYYYPSAFC